MHEDLNLENFFCILFCSAPSWTLNCSQKDRNICKDFLKIFSRTQFKILSNLFSCASCHSSCATCNGSSETQCITCRSGRFAFDGKCLNNCPDGYYGDKKRQECIECPNGCATCTGNGFCLTCKEPSWIKNKKGRCMVNGSENCDEGKCFLF